MRILVRISDFINKNLFTMSKTITENAQMQCTLGAAPVPLTVTSQFTVKISGAKVATEMDIASMVHIPSFGVCKCSSPPPPCVPAPTAWQKTSAVHAIDGKKSLTGDSFCMCSKGGKISFIHEGKYT